MNLNQRQVRLLGILLNEPSYLPTIKAATQLHCSERTVRTDIHTIEAYFEQMGITASMASKRGNGIRLRCNNAERESITRIISERALSVNSSLDRYYRGMLLIACDARKTYSVEELAHAMLTNKQQAQEDVRQWNELLVPFGAHIARNHGLSIEGPEDYIRFFLVYSLFDLASTAMKRRIEPQLLHGNEAFFFSEIRKVETELGKFLTDNARHQVAVYLQIMVCRIMKGHVIEQNSGDISDAIEKLSDAIEDRFDIDLPPSERGMINKLFTVSIRRWTPDFQQLYEPSNDIREFVGMLFEIIYMRFGKRPPAHLEKPCAELIEAGLTHKKHQYPISLPQENTRTVRFDNMASFLRLAEVFRDTPKLADLNLYETDVTRIAMLFLSHMDGLSSHDQWRVGLVVNCGIEQVYYARDRIERVVPCIKIAQVLTDREASLDASKNAGTLRALDFLISFDPIETVMPVVVIGPAINEADRARIESMLVQLGNPYAAQIEEFGREATEEKLSLKQNQTLEDALYNKLASEGLWKGRRDEFPSLLEMHSFRCKSWMMFTVFSRDVSRTGVLSLSVNAKRGFLGDKVEHILVLCVALEDERLLTPLTQRFKQIALQNGFPKDQH